MSKNYAVYPMKTMKITQGHSGTASHLTHTTGNPKDYPIDDAGADGGRDYMYCPCDEMRVVRIYGVGNSGTNTVWLTSTEKCDFPDGTRDYLTVSATHPNDDDLKKLKLGQIFKRGEKMFREGTDGNATGNHLHLSFGKGKISGNGWAKNTKNKWVLTTLSGTFKPEELIFLSGTTVLKNGGLTFYEMLPKEKTYQTTAVLNIRQLPAVTAKKIDAYKKGKKIKVVAVYGNWGMTDKGWVCLDYCEKVK